MSIQLDNAASTALSASTTSISELLSTVTVTADMISRFGSERSARFGTIAANLISNDKDTAYTKCRLYAAWKQGYKEERNRVYKNITELAENCGESRANFGLYAKVGAVFFSGESAVAGWAEKRYNVAALFELSALTPKVLHAVDTLLSVDADKRLSTTQARVLKEAFTKGARKDETTFLNTFVYKERGESVDESGEKHDTFTMYTPVEFLNRVCNWKEYTANDTTANDTPANDGDKTTDAAKDEKSDKSGFSLYAVIHVGFPANGTVYSDSKESEIINYLSERKFVITTTEHKSRSVSRTFLHVDDNGNADDVIILNVSPYTVAAAKAETVKFNVELHERMDADGASAYYRPYTYTEYLDSMNTLDIPALLNV